MLSEVRHADATAGELTSYTPATHVASVAALIRSTVQSADAQPSQTPYGGQGAQEYVELK
jgi:hypothetical protein